MYELRYFSIIKKIPFKLSKNELSIIYNSFKENHFAQLKFQDAKSSDLPQKTISVVNKDCTITKTLQNEYNGTTKHIAQFNSIANTIQSICYNKLAEFKITATFASEIQFDNLKYWEVIINNEKFSQITNNNTITVKAFKGINSVAINYYSDKGAVLNQMVTSVNFCNITEEFAISKQNSNLELKQKNRCTEE